MSRCAPGTHPDGDAGSRLAATVPATAADGAPGGWRPPTRRMFVSMIGAAAAAFALRAPTGASVVAMASEAPARPWMGTTRWIGHG